LSEINSRTLGGNCRHGNVRYGSEPDIPLRVKHRLHSQALLGMHAGWAHLSVVRTAPLASRRMSDQPAKP